VMPWGWTSPRINGKVRSVMPQASVMGMDMRW
jgi:hypothetical protein